MLGTGVTGVGGLSTVASADQSENTVSAIVSEMRDKVLNRVEKDPQVRRLGDYIEKRGWSLQFDDADVFEIQGPNAEASERKKGDSNGFYTAVIPAVVSDKEKPSRTQRWEIVWNSVPPNPSSPDSFARVYSSKQVAGDGSVEVIRQHVEQGEVTELSSESTEVESGSASTSGVSTASTCTTGDFKLYCKSLPSNSCLLSLAATATSCATCPFGSILSCIGCALGEASFALSGCLLDTCSVVCVDKFTEPSGGDGYVPGSGDDLTCDGPTGPGGVCRDPSLI